MEQKTEKSKKKEPLKQHEEFASFHEADYKIAGKLWGRYWLNHRRNVCN